MRSFLINKNISLYYWLRKRSGKTIALEVANTIERVILIFGRERMPAEEIRIRNKIRQLELIYQYQEEYSDMEAHELHAFHKIRSKGRSSEAETAAPQTI